MDFPGGASGKEPICQCRRCKKLGFDPGWGRSAEGEHGHPFQYSCLENPHGQRNLVGYIVHRVTKSQTWLKPLSRHTVIWKDIFFYMLHEGGNFKICYIWLFENVCWVNALLHCIKLWPSYIYVFRYEFLLTATKKLASENWW